MWTGPRQSIRFCPRLAALRPLGFCTHGKRFHIPLLMVKNLNLNWRFIKVTCIYHQVFISESKKLLVEFKLRKFTFYYLNWRWFTELVKKIFTILDFNLPNFTWFHQKIIIYEIKCFLIHRYVSVTKTNAFIMLIFTFTHCLLWSEKSGDYFWSYF